MNNATDVSDNAAYDSKRTCVFVFEIYPLFLLFYMLHRLLRSVKWWHSHSTPPPSPNTTTFTWVLKTCLIVGTSLYALRAVPKRNIGCLMICKDTIIPEQTSNGSISCKRIFYGVGNSPKFTWKIYRWFSGRSSVNPGLVIHNKWTEDNRGL